MPRTLACQEFAASTIDQHVLNAFREERRVIFSPFLPSNSGNPILFTEDLVQKELQIMHFVVIYADEDYAVLAQQIPRQEEPRVHHVQPLGMIASTGLGVGG